MLLRINQRFLFNATMPPTSVLPKIDEDTVHENLLDDRAGEIAKTEYAEDYYVTQIMTETKNLSQLQSMFNLNYKEFTPLHYSFMLHKADQLYRQAEKEDIRSKVNKTEGVTAHIISVHEAASIGNNLFKMICFNLSHNIDKMTPHAILNTLKVLANTSLESGGFEREHY